MDGSTIADFGAPLAIETLFRDAYNILEEIQRAPEPVDSVLGVLVHCHRVLRNLERIQQTFARTRGPDSDQDPFKLRGALDGFIATCNSFNYVLNPFVQPRLQAAEGCLPGPQWAWKRKQVKPLEQDFYGHQRTLSLLLTNAIYTTTLEMQRQSPQHDPAISFILRQVEKRHRLFEVMDTSSKDSAMQKLARSRAQEIDWEFCLRRYFDYLDSWAQEQSDHPMLQRSSYVGRPRRLSHSSEPETYGMRRSVKMDPSISFTSHQAMDEMDTSRFFRQPRDRNSLRANSLTAASQPPLLVRSRPGGQSSSSKSSRTMVQQPDIWQESPLWPVSSPVLPSPVLAPSPLIVPAPSVEVPWERLTSDTNGWLIVDIARDFPGLRAAHRDIIRETRTMNTAEARAYIQGRLAVMPLEAVNKIKERLVETPQRRHSAHAIANHSDPPRLIKTPEPPPKDETKPRVFAVAGNLLSAYPTITQSPKSEAKKSRAYSFRLSATRKAMSSPPNTAGSDRSMEDPLERLREQERKKTKKRKTVPGLQISSPINVSMPQVQSPTAGQKPLPRAIDSLKSSQARPQSKVRRSRVGSLKLKDIRPLSAISERPYTARSWKSFRSKASKSDSIERAPSINALLPATKARISVTSLELVFELQKAPSDEPAPPSSPNTDKALPPIPDSEKPVQLPAWLAHPSPLGSHPPRSRDDQTDESVSAPKPRALRIEHPGRHGRTRMSLPPTVRTARQIAARDALQHKESRLRLMTFHEGLDKEFGVWLKALPYIEGRGGSPPKKDTRRALEI